MDIMRRTWARVFDNPQAADSWVVDLAAATRLPGPELSPLRNWALSQLASLPFGQPKFARLPWTAIEPLAYLCGLDEVELVRRLPRPEPRLARSLNQGD